MRVLLMSLAVSAMILSSSAESFAQEENKDEYVITIKNHIFSPEELKVPAGEKVKLVIDNQDATPEEFESYELNREKIISGNSKGIVFIGPLEPGTYPYFGEFNMETAKGTIIAE